MKEGSNREATDVVVVVYRKQVIFRSPCRVNGHQLDRNVPHFKMNGCHFGENH